MHNHNDAWKIIQRLGAVGILTPADLPALDSQRWRVLELMADCKWHAGPEIVNIANGSEGLRRLRELRDLKCVSVQRTRGRETRTFWYKLEFTQPMRQTGDLFGFDQPML